MASPQVYDFLSEENEPKWKTLLCQALTKIQKQVHPRLDIEEEAVEYLEVLIYQLLGQMCAAQPHSIPDVETHVGQTFASPIDMWSLSDAQEKMERYQARKRGIFLFPIDKIFQLMQKEVFAYKIDVSLVQFIMGILDYVAADVLKLAGNFVKNTQKPAVIISLTDVRVSMSADPALQALLKPFNAGGEPFNALAVADVEFSTDRASMKYDELLRDLMDNEAQFIRQLNLILKVFMPPFLENKEIISSDEVDVVFDHLADIHELSIALLASMEEMVEIASEMEGGSRYPQIGFCFEEFAESEEFSVYMYYTENYMDAVMNLESIMKDSDVVDYFKQLSADGKVPNLFKEAVQYLLPRAMLEPIYHFFYYISIMQAMLKATEDEEDYTAFESALSTMLAEKLQIERESGRFLPRRREEAMMFGRRIGYRFSMKKLITLQSKIEAWEGPDIHDVCTELLKEGTISVVREGGKRTQKARMERHVFLLDGLVLCCKPKKGGGNGPEYRLKEKINMRAKVELTDFEEDGDLKFAFQLREADQPGIIFFTLSPPDKNEWMAALTLLLTRSTFERRLDEKLRKEEQNIPDVKPDTKIYPFAEPDSEENVMFEEEKRDGQVDLIKAATIHKLVERLTHHKYADPNFVRTFLMTYRSFCQPGELLKLLIERYHIPLPDPDNIENRIDPLKREGIKRFKANYVSPIQLRVLNVLRHWVDSHYYDFERDPDLLEKLMDFVSTVKAKNMQKWVSSIHRSLTKQKEEAVREVNVIFSEEPPPIEWHLTRKKEEFNVLTLHPVEFARQLTLILSELFRAIRPSELVDASWTKEGKKEDASPNLLKTNRFETKLSQWVKYTIVHTENFEERLALVCRLVDIMVVLRDMNNFAALFALNAAFQSSQVYRLKHTMKELARVAPRKKVVLEEVQQLASSDRGYKNYKERLRAINPPCIPFVGMYQTWIVFIRDGSDGKVKGKPDHFINFKKRRMIAGVLQEIQQYQNTPYCLTPEPSIQDYILNQDVKGNLTDNQFEKELYDQSLEVEPRDQPCKKVPRRYKFDLRPPSAGTSSLVHLLDIRRGGDKKKYSTMPYPSGDVQEGAEPSSKESGTVSPLPGTSPTTELPGVPPVPPRPSNANLAALDVWGSVHPPPAIPPPIPPPRLPPKPSSSDPMSVSPRSASPNYGNTNFPPGYFTYRFPKAHNKPPIPIPIPESTHDNNISSSSNLPPRPPRNSDPHPPPLPPSPLSKEPPPLPPPSHLNDGVCLEPPPLPPLPPSVSFNGPQASLPLLPGSYQYSSHSSLPASFINMDDSQAPPTLPPKPTHDTRRRIASETTPSSIPAPPLPPRAGR